MGKAGGGAEREVHTHTHRVLIFHLHVLGILFFTRCIYTMQKQNKNSHKNNYKQTNKHTHTHTHNKNQSLPAAQTNFLEKFHCFRLLCQIIAGSRVCNQCCRLTLLWCLTRVLFSLLPVQCVHLCFTSEVRVLQPFISICIMKSNVRSHPWKRSHDSCSVCFPETLWYSS